MYSDQKQFNTSSEIVPSTIKKQNLRKNIIHH